MNLDLLPVFVSVADAQSFSVAAKKLGIPKSSVSRGISTLEAQLGTQLLHRTTRHVALTTAGTALYERVAPALRTLREAVGSLPEQEEEPAGALRITAPIDLSAVLLADVISRFTVRYPAVKVDVRLTNTLVDLAGEGYDLALRASGKRLADSALVVRRLSEIEFQMFAAPSYVARRGAPRGPDDIGGHEWVMFRAQRFTGPWVPISTRARVFVDDFLLLRSVVLAGTGVGMMPSFLAQSEVAAGNLVRVLPKFSERSGTLYLLHPPAKHVPRKVTAFRDLLLETLAARPLSP